MGIFCGENCRCRRSCNEYLNWNDGAKSACRKACGGNNPPPDGYTWWNDLPPEIRLEYEGGVAAAYLKQEAGMASDGTVPDVQAAGTGLRYVMIGLGILLLGLSAYLILK